MRSDSARRILRNYTIDTKANVLLWLISAQGLQGIPSLINGYNLTVSDIVERFDAKVDEYGRLIPVNVCDVYFKSGRRVSVSEIKQDICIEMSPLDILSTPVEILPAPPEGFYWSFDKVEIDQSCDKVKTECKLNKLC